MRRRSDKINHCENTLLLLPLKMQTFKNLFLAESYWNKNAYVVLAGGGSSSGPAFIAHSTPPPHHFARSESANSRGCWGVGSLFMPLLTFNYPTADRLLFPLNFFCVGYSPRSL